MHLGWHVGAAVLMGGAASSVVGNFGKLDWMGVVMGMVGIDLIDHGLWGAIKIRPLTIKKVWQVGMDLYKRMEGQFFFFHTIEVFILAMILVSRFSWGKWFMLAYCLHLLMDSGKYLSVRNGLGWAKKWSMMWWIGRMVKFGNG